MNTLKKIKIVFKTIKTLNWIRKKRFAFLLIFFLGLLALRPYFHSGVPYTHDGENHLARFANYKLAVREGQIPPRLAPNLHNRYGYPVFNYNYPLANILSLPFSALKLNYELTFKVLASVFVYTGLIGVYTWLGSFAFSEKTRLFGLSVYGLSPYLFSTIFYRGNIGELAAWGVIPLLLVIVERIAKLNKTSIFDLSIYPFVFALFFLSHNVTVLFVTPVIMFYGWLRFGSKIEKWRKLLLVYAYAVLLSLWFWLPALAEKHLIVLDNVSLSTGFVNHFPTLLQLIFSPLEFGFSYVGSIDSLSFSLGLAQVLLLLGASFILVLKRKSISLSRFWFGLIFLVWMSFFFQLKISKPIWQVIPFSQFIQFPWRLGLLFAVFTVPLAAFFYSHFLPKLKVFLWLLLLWQAVVFARLEPVDYFHKLNRDYDAFSQTTSTLNENMPNRFSYSDIGDWQPSPTILAGEGQIQVDYWKGSDRQYTVDLSQVSAIAEPTARFAGWVTYAQRQGEDTWQKLSYIENPIIQGRVAYELEPGSYLVRSRFTQWTWPRLVGNTFSLVTFLMLVINMGFYTIGTKRWTLKK